MFVDEDIRPCRVTLEPLALSGTSEEQDQPIPAGDYGSTEVSVKCGLCNLIFSCYAAFQKHSWSIHKRLFKEKCHECNIYFAHRFEKFKHLDLVHGESPTKCIYCGQVYKIIGNLVIKHVKKFHSDVAVWCGFKGTCKKLFLNEHERRNHILRAHKTSSRQQDCIYSSCKTVFPCAKTLTAHLNKEHDGAYLRCDYIQNCPSFFITEDKLAEHVKQVHENPTLSKLRCIYCLKKVFDLHKHTKIYHKGKKVIRCRYITCITFFRSEQERLNHEKEVHSLKKNKHTVCRLCQKTIYIYSIQNHINVNHKNMSLTLCKYHRCHYFGTTEEIETHYKESHDFVAPNRIKCIYCGWICAKLSYLKHVKKNHRLQAIKCTFKCREYFLSLADRDAHIAKEHSKAPERKYVDCVYCKKNLYDQSIHAHVQKKHKECSIKCSLRFCGQYFLSQSDYQKHYQEKHKEKEENKKITCHLCSYRTTSKVNLLDHLDRLHGTKKIACPKCPKMYKSKLTLKVHLQRVHEKERRKCHHCGQYFVNLFLHQRWTKCKKCLGVTHCFNKTWQHKRDCTSK